MLDPMSTISNIMSPALARQLFKQGEAIKKRQCGKPAAIENFTHLIKPLTGLWRFSECLDFLEDLILIDDGLKRLGFSDEVQEELMFLYRLLIDQHELLTLGAQRQL